MAEEDQEQQPQRVPVRRRAGAGAVTVMTPESAVEVAEGDIYELGVWPWEITEEHGWERVSRREAREASRSAREESEAEQQAMSERVAAEQAAAAGTTQELPEQEGGSS